MGKRIGIDLGTTNSVVAYIPEGQGRPRIIENREGKPATPSIVSLKMRKGKPEASPDSILVGELAFKNWEMAPENTIYSIKRLMGRTWIDPEVQKVRENLPYKVVKPSEGTEDSVSVVMGGREHSPIEISAMILRKLKADAEYHLNDQVTHAVVTVPAYFSQNQKRATREACMLAGMKVLKVLDEPTAAAIASGIITESETEAKYLLVYDLGGGTFDISLGLLGSYTWAPLTKGGDMWLGGDNFDEAIVKLVINYLQKEYPEIRIKDDKRAMVILKKEAQDAKERLSSTSATDISLQFPFLTDRSGNIVEVDMELTSEMMAPMVKDLIQRSLSITQKALTEANLTPDQIHYVLMAGNATRMPLVENALKGMFPLTCPECAEVNKGNAMKCKKCGISLRNDRFIRVDNPKHCVALGAAILAAQLDRLICPECEEVNEMNAMKCKGCGMLFELPVGAEQPESEQIPGEIIEIAEKRDVGPRVGVGISAFNYGIQSVGDKFNVFIRKNDPFPTVEPETQQFYTQNPNQRIINIPIYGGLNLEKASLNTKEGIAVAVLPPMLPQGAGIRVKFAMDDNEIFKVEAYLDDNTDLHPLVMSGGKDAQAVEALEEMESIFERKFKDASPDTQKKLEEARCDAYEYLRRREYDKAIA
ncbi:MAG: Hsp70 family protein, partial [Calditrichota bacterium]